jgi:hypothetical protein
MNLEDPSSSPRSLEHRLLRLLQAARDTQDASARAELNMLLRAKYLVDTVNYNQVRGLPFKTDELAGVITDVLASL